MESCLIYIHSDLVLQQYRISAVSFLQFAIAKSSALQGIASAAIQRTQEPSVTVASLPDFPTQAGSLPCKMVCLRVPAGSRRASADQPLNPFQIPEEAAAGSRRATLDQPTNPLQNAVDATTAAGSDTGKETQNGAARRSSGGRKERKSSAGDACAGSPSGTVAEEERTGSVQRKGAEGRPPTQSKRRAAIEASLTAGATGNRRRSSYSDAKTGPPEDRQPSPQSVSRRASVTRSSAADNRGLAEILPEGVGQEGANHPRGVDDPATSAMTSADGAGAVRKMERRASGGELLTSARKADVSVRSSLESLQKHRQNPAIMKWVKERLLAREKNGAAGGSPPEQDAMLQVAASRLIGNMEELWQLGPGPLKIGAVI